jgi:hypothetical protein
MEDLQAIVQQLRKIAADNEAYRQEQARLRETDKRELAKQRLLDREYLDQRLLCMETSFSKILTDVSNAVAASCSTISSQSSKRSREIFENANEDHQDDHIDDSRAIFEHAVEDRHDEDVDTWLAGQPAWAFEAGDGVLEGASDPKPQGMLQHTQLYSHARAHSDMESCTVMKVLPSDNPRQCLLCGIVFKYKRFGITFAFSSLHI